MGCDIMIDDLKHAIRDTENYYGDELLTLVLSPRGFHRLNMSVAHQKRRRVQKVITVGGLKTFVEKNQVEPFRIVIR